VRYRGVLCDQGHSTSWHALSDTLGSINWHTGGKFRVIFDHTDVLEVALELPSPIILVYADSETRRQLLTKMAALSGNEGIPEWLDT
jgi:hypothetical protein